MKKFWLITMVMFILCGCSAEKYNVEENADVAALEVFEEDDVLVSEDNDFEIEENPNIESTEIADNESTEDTANEAVITEEAAVTEITEVETENEEEKVTYTIIGNRKSKKYHLPTCHTLPYPKNQVFFDSAEEAASSGYKPCKNCRP